MQSRSGRVAFAPGLKIGQRVQDECQRLGLIGRCIGDRIAFTPPLIISAVQIGEMAALFRRALDNVSAAI